MATALSKSHAVALLLILSLGPSTGAFAETSVAEFDSDENKKLEWRVVNDGVMGGLSRGQLAFPEEGILKFSGKLSLKNNGGFSLVETGKTRLDLSSADGLVMRVKGDGRTYQARLATDVRFRGREVSFAAEFPTSEDEWVEVKVPFDELVGTFRGMTLNDAEFDPAKVQRVGILLADKKEGPFSIKVDWIRTYGGGDSTIAALAAADGRFETLVKALGKAELVKALKGNDSLTVFAPTDEAFARLPEGTLEKLLKPENRERLKSILTYHVSGGRTDLATALGSGEVTTLQGESLTVEFADGSVRVGDAAVVDADLEASNGLIHVIDSVLIPPQPAKATDLLGVAEAAGNFTTLLAAVEAAGLKDTLKGEGPFTILAPTDEAFAKLPKGTVESLLKEQNRKKLKAILTYHAIAGAVSAGDALNAGVADTINGKSVKFSVTNGLFRVNSATIQTVDIECDNGVIHVIDAVLLPTAAEKGKDDNKKMSVTDRIEAAIERGVPIFNSGDHEGCAKVYRECLIALTKDEQLDKELRKRIESALDHTSNRMSGFRQAWRYRGILDHIYAMVSQSES